MTFLLSEFSRCNKHNIFRSHQKKNEQYIIKVCSAPMLDRVWSATLTADQSKTNHGVSQTPCDPHGCLHNTTKPRLN